MLPSTPASSQEAAMNTIPSAATRGDAEGAAIGAQAGDAEQDAAAQLLRLMWGIHVSRCVYAVAELGIADLLANGPVDSAELARATGSHEPSLYRVLRLLAALGVFEEHEHRSFGLTALGTRLRSDASVGMRSWARLLEALGGVRPFEHILETVRTGEAGFDLAFGSPIFGFLAQNPDKAARFDAAMSERTAAFAPSVAATHDFSSARMVIDVGGGRGTLLAEILRRHGHLHGVLLETSTVAADAEAMLGATGIGGRLEVLPGDFFEQIPAGADRYLLANVLHDWDDARSIEILRNCRRAMARTGRVLILERLIPEHGSDPVPTLLSDINMLVLTGGRERTTAEYRELLAAAGLKLDRVRAVAFPYGILEGVVA
jgi:O-methyltransferase domain/Dimerisation domain